MIAEFSLYGVFVPTLLVWFLIALAVSWLLRRLFERIQLYRLVWHRPLFDFATLIIVLGGITALARIFT